MIVLAIGSVPIFILGFVIWKFKVVEIIAGYDENKVTDKDGLARWVGIGLMLTSIAMIGSYFILENFDFSNGLKILILVGVLNILLLVMVLGTKRYEK